MKNYVAEFHAKNGAKVKIEFLGESLKSAFEYIEKIIQELSDDILHLASWDKEPDIIASAQFKASNAGTWKKIL